MTPPLDLTRPFLAADLLREARSRLPELADEIDGCELVPGSVLGECLAYEMADWVREATWDVDRDVVLRIFGLWSDTTEHPRVEPNLAHSITTALGVLRVYEQPYGREVAERTSPRMQSLMECAPRMVGLG